MCSQCARPVTPARYCTQEVRARIHKIETWLLANHGLFAVLLPDEKTAPASNANVQENQSHTMSTLATLSKVCGKIDHLCRHLDDNFCTLKDSVTALKKPLNASMPRDSVGGNTEEATEGGRLVHAMQHKAVEMISLLLEARKLYADLKRVRSSNLRNTESGARGDDTGHGSGHDDDCEDNTPAGPYGTTRFREDIDLALRNLRTGGGRPGLNVTELQQLLDESKQVCYTVDRQYTQLLARKTPSPDTTQDLSKNLQELHTQMYKTYVAMSAVGMGKLIAPDNDRVL